MVINWRRNKKKFPVFLLTSIFLLLAIGVFLVNFISIKYTFENASFSDMFNKKYREDENYVNTCVEMFHTLVQDACYRQGVYFENATAEDSVNTYKDAEKIRGYEGIYNYVKLSYDYKLRFALKDLSNSVTGRIDPGKLGMTIYNNGDLYTGRSVGENKIAGSKLNGNPYRICRVKYAGNSTKDSFLLFSKGEDGEYQYSQGNSTYSWSGDQEQYSYIENENGDIIYFSNTLADVTELTEYGTRQETNSSMTDSYFYTVQDKEGKYVTLLDVGVDYANSDTEPSLDGSNIEWKTVLNAVYALTPYEPEYVPLLFVTSNREMGVNLTGNSAFVEAYRERYKEENVFVPYYENDRNVNLKRYTSGNTVLGGKMATKQNLLSYIRNNDMVVGLFADWDFQFSNMDSPLYSYEFVAGSVRCGTVLTGFLLMLAILSFVGEMRLYVSREKLITARVFALEWLPVELRILVLAVLVYASGYCYLLRQQEKWAGSFFITMVAIPVLLLICMGIQCCRDYRQFFSRSLIGWWAERHVERLARKKNEYPVRGLGYQLNKRTVSFACAEIVCAVLLLVWNGLRWGMPEFWNKLWGDTGVVVYWAVMAVLLLVITVVFLLYFRFVTIYAKGMEGIQQQLEWMGQGDFETMVPLPEEFECVNLDTQFQRIKDSVMTAVANEMKSERMKIDLVANVSHDIKTPLTSIINYVDLLADSKELPPVEQDYVKILQRKSYRLRSMIQDLFDLSKASSGNLSVEFREIDFGKLIQQTMADMQEQIENSTLQFKCKLEDDVKIYSDGDRLYRVLQNLISNALKYSMENSRVYLELSTQENKAVFTIKNMSRTELNFTKEEVMERFFRGDKSRSTEGSGLGVAIASSFTEVCNGNFDIEINADLFCARMEFPLLFKENALEKEHKDTSNRY